MSDPTNANAEACDRILALGSNTLTQSDLDACDRILALGSNPLTQSDLDWFNHLDTVTPLRDDVPDFSSSSFDSYPLW